MLGENPFGEPAREHPSLTSIGILARLQGVDDMFLITKEQGIRPVCLRCHQVFRSTSRTRARFCESCERTHVTEQKYARRMYRDAMELLAASRTTAMREKVREMWEESTKSASPICP